MLAEIGKPERIPEYIRAPRTRTTAFA